MFGRWGDDFFLGFLSQKFTTYLKEQKELREHVGDLWIPDNRGKVLCVCAFSKKINSFHQILICFSFFKRLVYFRERVKVCVLVGGGVVGEEERENQADSPLNTEPDLTTMRS